MPKEEKKTQNMRLDEEEIIETGEALSLEEGMHTGIIKNAYGEQTPQGYRYFQLEIVPEDQEEITLRYGCAIPEEGRSVTPASKLGKLLQTFGLDISPDKIYRIRDMKDAVMSRKVKFATINEETRDAQGKLKGTFAKIVDNSLKPVKEKTA